MTKKSAGAEVEEGAGLQVDLRDVDESVFEVMPKAMYPVEIEALDFEYSEAKGNPMWSWVLVISEGDYADRKLFYHTVFAGKGLPFTKRTLGRIMPDLLEGPFDPEAIANSGDLIGKALRARVGIQKYEGEDRNNVKDLFPAEEGGF